ncbi:segregation and condensation protein A [Streptomyces sp. NRRL F-5135]|uniref:segregation and condensation protein A n=1 Tax=Streptomyces sp. NRRL F-5135 TaxID=1463858 RepID=UPI000A869DB4|nr:segregation/condensation protein A [Streptomyces sp. NRRL F-5135]
MPPPPPPFRRPRRPLGRGPGLARPTAPGPEAPGPDADPERAPRPVDAASPDRGDPAAGPPAPADGPGTAPEAGPPAPVGPGSDPDGGREAGDTAVRARDDAARAEGGTTRAGDDTAATGQAGPADGPDRDGGEGDAARAVDGPAEGDPRLFTVRLVNFEGPFDLLLQLISKHKLDVTEVALSKVTDEFMAHIRGMGPDWDLDQTTEFLVVAATLLDLKAARLLPAAEVEDEADLALLEARDLLFARLLQYRAYKRIAEIFQDRLDAEARRHPRTVGLEPHHAELLPEVVIGIGPEGFARLAVKAMRPKPPPRVYVDHIHAPLVSVREQAGIVVARLRERGESSFQELTEDAADTLTVVARFLALLELYRERAVALDQDEALGALMIRWTGGDDGAEPAVTDEFDQLDQLDQPGQEDPEDGEDGEDGEGHEGGRTGGHGEKRHTGTAGGSDPRGRADGEGVRV